MDDEHDSTQLNHALAFSNAAFLNLDALPKQLVKRLGADLSA
jgi:hypothetical protein